MGNDSVSIVVMFRPASFGNYVDTLSIISDGGTKKIVLAGSSPYPLVNVVGSVEFGSLKIGQSSTKNLNISNVSINNLTIDSVKLKSKVFSLSGTVFPATISSNDTLTIGVKFTPDSSKTSSDTLFLFNNSNVSPVRVALTGLGNLLSVMRNGDVIPGSFMLAQNYPNPFNPSTTISFSLPKSSNVSLLIYDALGREVTTLLKNESMSAGNYSTQWNAASSPSGVYFYRITAGDFTQVKKMLMIK